MLYEECRPVFLEVNIYWRYQFFPNDPKLLYLDFGWSIAFKIWDEKPAHIRLATDPSF